MMDIGRHREEEAAFNSEVESVASWMATPRFRYSKRPYTAMDVVRLRSPLHRMTMTMTKHALPSPVTVHSRRVAVGDAIGEYAGVQPAKKLDALLRSLAAQGKYSHTFGCLDPVQVAQMAPYLSSVYVR